MKNKRMRMTLTKDPTNIIITGVGGQGNVMASRVLAGMLVDQGYFVTIGETFGMSQRGGSVMSHLRVSAKSVWSPQIPLNKANIVVALEPSESLRVVANYGNPSVVVLSNSRVVYPIGVITGDYDYPSLDTIKSIFDKTTANNWLVDATSVAIDLGNPVLGNIVMIGALAKTNLLPIDRNAFIKEISSNFAADKRAANIAAFDAGMKMI